MTPCRSHAESGVLWMAPANSILQRNKIDREKEASLKWPIQREERQSRLEQIEMTEAMNKKRILTDSAGSFGQNPFASLNSEGLPAGPEVEAEKAEPEVPARNRGRVDIIRQTAHRGGKTVTVVTNFVGIGLAEKEKLAKQMQKACGTGGTVKEGRIEIQGDKRQEVAKILSAAGFRPVFAGG
jgi:translation initiation factor 1